MDAPRLLAMLTALISMAVVFLFKTYADTRFLSLTGSAWLPQLLVAQALLMILLSAAYAFLVRRLTPLRLDLLLTGGAIVGGLVAPTLFEQGIVGIFSATLILLSLPAIANLALWNSAQGIVSGRAIRHFLPRLGAVATGGATLGSLAASRLSIDFGVESLAPTATLLTLGLCGVRIALEHHYPKLATQGSQAHPHPHLQPPRLALDGRRLITLLALATVLEALVAGLIDYGFKRELTEALNPGDLAVFLSLFYAFANATMLLVQWFGAARLFSLHPLSRTTTLTPMAMVATSLLWLLFPSLWMLTAARFGDAVMRFAVARPSLEISLSPLDRAIRRRWKVLLRGGFAQIGTVIAGLLLIPLSGLLDYNPGLLAGALLSASLLWLLVQRRVAHRYMKLLAHTIGRKQLNRLRDSDNHLPDHSAIRQLLPLLDDPDVETQRFTREFLAGLELDAEVLIPHLAPPPSPRVREVLYGLIAAHPNPHWGNSLASVVAREQPDSRGYGAALHALAACAHPGETARARALLGDQPPRKMSDRQLAAALYLARVGTLPRPGSWPPEDLVLQLLERLRGRDAGLALRGLMMSATLDRDQADRLLATAPVTPVPAQAGARAARLQAQALIATPQALQALAVALSNGQSETDAAIPLLSDKDLWRLVHRVLAGNPRDETRRRLAYCLRFHHGPQSVRETARFLDDRHAAVRRTAVRSLLRKRQEHLGAAPRHRYDRALDRRLQSFEHLVYARVAELERPPTLFDRELEQRSDQALDELTGLLALSGDPASIFSARRSLGSPDPFLRRQSLDALQEVMRGARQRRLIHLLDRYLTPGDPSPAERERAAQDPWLARCLDGSLDDIADWLLVLRDTALFCDLDGQRLEELVRTGHCRTLPTGEAVIRRGDPGEHLFVVLSGEVEFITNGRPGNRRGSGTVFGELALLDRGPRSVTVETRADTQLLCIDRSTFLGLIEVYPEIGIGLLGVLAGWLRS